MSETLMGVSPPSEPAGAGDAQDRELSPSELAAVRHTVSSSSAQPRRLTDPQNPTTPGDLHSMCLLPDARPRQVADQLLEVPGVAAVMLGGSRARGAEKPDSDVDLGLYYRPPLGCDKLQALADALATARSGQARPKVTRPGEWGPWVDCGGWLTIEGMAVDWIYRDLDRVHQSWKTAQEGTFNFHLKSATR